MSSLICESVVRDDAVPVRFVNVWANIDHSNNIVRSSGGLSAFIDTAAGRGTINFTDTISVSSYVTSGCANGGSYVESSTTRAAAVVGPSTPFNNAFSTAYFAFQSVNYDTDATLDCRELWIHVIG
jgi:hypothetical protein